jgi:hypothetical protein
MVLGGGELVWERSSMMSLPTQNFVKISDPKMCAPYPIHLTLLHLIMIIFGEEYK